MRLFHNKIKLENRRIFLVVLATCGHTFCRWIDDA